jgi:hypothetical protein
MKKKNFLLISESERNSILGMHKERILRETEKDWVDQEEDMDAESDFSKMEVKDKSKEATENLTDEEQDMLRDFIETEGMDSLEDMIEDSLEGTELNEEDMDDYEEDEMSEREFKIRSIIDKIVTYATAGAAIGMLPAAMFISGGVATALGIGALAGTTLKDIAWFKSGGKYKDHHYDKSDKSRKDW